MQTCTYLAIAQRTMTSAWWCAATVRRWWSLRHSRRTVRGGTVVSVRRALGRPPWLHSSNLVPDPLLSISPHPERGGRMVNIKEPTLPPRPYYLSTSEGLPRLTRRQQGTAKECLHHGNRGDEKMISSLIVKPCGLVLSLVVIKVSL